MNRQTSIADVVSETSRSFSGALLRPGDTGYEDARRVHNGLIDRRPALIARCRGTADVVDAVNLARTTGLVAAVRGGGHNVSGRATVDDGVMIDLAPMKGLHVDPRARVARVQGGVNWGEFNRETQLHGLGCTGGVVSTTGVAGLTLGGGIGWLMGRHGLALDNLLSVDLVTAEGKVARACAEENPDLFWGVRGGGGNFGIATSFEFRLHSVGPVVTGGLVVYPFERARDVLRFYREFTASVSDELTVFAGLVHAADGSGAKVAVMVACHCGSLDEGKRAVEPLRSLGAPLMDALGPTPYSALNAMLDGGYPKGALNYWKSSFVPRLTDDAIGTMVEGFAACPAPMGQILIEHVHGAVTRVPVDETAFPHRAEGYNLLVLGEWLDPETSDACIGWTRRTYSALSPAFGEGRYVNYLSDDEGSDTVAAAYGPNYPRLQAIKARWDPDNFFRMNQNIRPPA